MKYIKYIALGFLAIVVAKWVILMLPVKTETVPSNVIKSINSISSIKRPRHEEIKVIDFKNLNPQIEQEYTQTKNDIKNYIVKQINMQKSNSNRHLDKFLKWLFGYKTGWTITWLKIRGKDVKGYVQRRLEKIVLKPGLNEMYHRIDVYANKRMEDFYKNAIIMTENYINNQIKQYKKEGFTNIKIDTSSLPWVQYMTHRTGDSLIVAEIGGVGVGLATGKVVGAKVASFIGTKGLSIVEAKTATIIASKIASGFELFLAPVIDYIANEGVKRLKYKKTKETFKKVIKEIYVNMQKDILWNVKQNLNKLRNNIYQNLNKQISIRVEK